MRDLTDSGRKAPGGADAGLGQINPADDRSDERSGARQCQQLRSLGRLGDGLDDHGLRHACGSFHKPAHIPRNRARAAAPRHARSASVASLICARSTNQPYLRHSAPG